MPGNAYGSNGVIFSGNNSTDPFAGINNPQQDQTFFEDVGDWFNKYLFGKDTSNDNGRFNDDQLMEFYKLNQQKQADDLAWLRTQSASAIDRKFNASEAEKVRKWQENMSNTAYQRSVQDLRKAGLNPILALGSPATTPSGASASVHSAGAAAGNYNSSTNPVVTSAKNNQANVMANVLGSLGYVVGALGSSRVSAASRLAGQVLYYASRKGK